jgi:hypothetical protein
MDERPLWMSCDNRLHDCHGHSPVSSVISASAGASVDSDEDKPESLGIVARKWNRSQLLAHLASPL